MNNKLYPIKSLDFEICIFQMIYYVATKVPICMIETNRLTIRQWKGSDFIYFNQMFSDPDASRFIGGVLDNESAWRLMASYIGHFQLKGFGYCAVESKSDKKFLGSVGLWHSAPWPELELGYWFLPSAQGHGYATESCKAFLKLAFEELNNSTLVSYIHPDNLSSIHLSRKLGGIYDGDIELLNYGNHQVYRYFKDSSLI